MARCVILVNGLPGVGKTTIARPLAHHLDAELLSKDLIKESLSAAVSPAVPSAALGAAAMEALWSLAAAVADRVVVDSFLFRPRDLEHLRAGLAVARAVQSIEVWCHCAIPLAHERYASRLRDRVHDDAHRLVDDWSAWATRAEPVGVGPVVRVDTSSQVDVVGLAARVDSALRQPG